MEKGLKKEGAAAIKGSQGTALGCGCGCGCVGVGAGAGAVAAATVALLAAGPVGSFAHQLSSALNSTLFQLACPSPQTSAALQYLQRDRSFHGLLFRIPDFSFQKTETKINKFQTPRDRQTQELGGVVPCFYSTSLGSVSFPANAKLAGSARHCTEDTGGN